MEGTLLTVFVTIFFFFFLFSDDFSSEKYQFSFFMGSQITAFCCSTVNLDFCLFHSDYCVEIIDRL